MVRSTAWGLLTMQGLVRGWIIAGLVFGVLLIRPLPVAAAETANCADFYTNRLLGVKVAGAKHGASSTFGFSTALCTNPGFLEISGSFLWSGVQKAGTGSSIVQVGIGNCRHPGSTVFLGDCWSLNYNFVAWGRNNSFSGCTGYSQVDPNPMYVSSYNGGSFDYKVYHKTNNWRFYIGNTQVYALGESSICWTPTDAIWFGEVWDYGDQLGGTPAAHRSATLLNYANAEDGGFVWTSFNPSAACNVRDQAPDPPFKCDITGATSYQIWTDR